MSEYKTCQWIRDLPGLNSTTISQADQIIHRREKLTEQLEDNYRLEAELFMTLYHSGYYSAQTMGEVAVKSLPWAVVKYLPKRLPPQKNKPKP